MVPQRLSCGFTKRWRNQELLWSGFNGAAAFKLRIRYDRKSLGPHRP